MRITERLRLSTLVTQLYTNGTHETAKMPSTYKLYISFGVQLLSAKRAASAFYRTIDLCGSLCVCVTL